MAKIDKHTLRHQIEQSLLMDEDLKSELIAKLESLNPRELKQLSKLVSSEQKHIDQMAKSAIASAVTNGETEKLEELQSSIKDAEKTLRHVEESAERGEEQDQYEHFFDTPNV